MPLEAMLISYLKIPAVSHDTQDDVRIYDITGLEEQTMHLHSFGIEAPA